MGRRFRLDRGGNAILFYLINGLVAFQPLAMRAVGGDIASFSNIG